jgi:hypothetical protein
MLSKLNVSTGNRALNPKGILWIEIQSAVMSLIVPVIKPTRCTNFTNLFWDETVDVSDSSSIHPQEFFTVHTAMVCVIQFCRQLASRIRMEINSILILLVSCLQTCMTYTIAV